MNQCKIVSIKPDGKPWDSQYGKMFPFYIVMEDGAAGTTNSKSETPPYKVGDEVGYEINGATPRGVPKLKITRNPKPGEATYTGGGATHPDLEAARPHNPPQNRPAAPTYTQTSPAHGNAVNGQTVGMAVKAAVDIHLKIRGTGAWGEEDAVTVEAIARDIVAISERIQSGNSVPF